MKKRYHPGSTFYLLRDIFSLNRLILLSLAYVITVLSGCNARSNTIKTNHKIIPPDYNQLELLPTTDTLHFALDDHTYNSIPSMYTFNHGGIDYLSFYDRRSKTLLTYEIENQKLVKKVSLKETASHLAFAKITAFILNKDTVFMATKEFIYRLDGNGIIKDSIKLPMKPQKINIEFNHVAPGYLKNDTLYAAIDIPTLNKDPGILRRRNVICAIDFKTKKISPLYNFPEVYGEHYYGLNFMNYSYCFDEKGNAIFSFSADPNIYKTDFYTFNISYLGRGLSQSSSVPPVDKKKYNIVSFQQRDSYGSIYYDPFTRRYIRSVFFGLDSSESYKNKKSQHLIVFDEQLKIIGESEIDKEINTYFTFTTSKGDIYARTEQKDDRALHFVKLIYHLNKSSLP